MVDSSGAATGGAETSASLLSALVVAGAVTGAASSEVPTGADGAVTAATDCVGASLCGNSDPAAADRSASPASIAVAGLLPTGGIGKTS